MTAVERMIRTLDRAIDAAVEIMALLLSNRVSYVVPFTFVSWYLLLSSAIYSCVVPPAGSALRSQFAKLKLKSSKATRSTSIASEGFALEVVVSMGLQWIDGNVIEEPADGYRNIPEKGGAAVDANLDSISSFR